MQSSVDLVQKVVEENHRVGGEVVLVIVLVGVRRAASQWIGSATNVASAGVTTQRSSSGTHEVSQKEDAGAAPEVSAFSQQLWLGAKSHPPSNWRWAKWAA